jgi:colanic acid/amylovoran biosynthesis glycosyltransferase
MQECLEAPVETLALMGEAAQKRVLERHNVDTQAAELESLFRGTLNKAGTR